MMKNIKIRSIALAVLGADAGVVLLHIFLGKENMFFNLDEESNLPTVYSSIKLVFIGLTSLAVFLAGKSDLDNGQKKREAFMWALLGIFFIYLGVDELLMVHENFLLYLDPVSIFNLGWFPHPGFYWIVVFLPFIMAVLAMLFVFIKMALGATKKAKQFFVLGVCAFALVIISELAGGYFLDTAGYYYAVIMEESLEMFGATFFLLGISAYSKKLS